MDEAERPVPVFARIPVYTGRSGQPLVSTQAVIIFIRSLANLTEGMLDGEQASLAAAIRIEADALECRAIEHTRGPR